jgi:hypothetical protein
MRCSGRRSVARSVKPRAKAPLALGETQSGSIEEQVARTLACRWRVAAVGEQSRDSAEEEKGKLDSACARFL